MVPLTQTLPLESTDSLGIPELKSFLLSLLRVPERSPDGSFYFAVDHCFPIKGQGTVITGTVLKGSVHVNDSLEIVSIGSTKKVKSMQMFHKPVEMAMQVTTEIRT